MLRKLAAALVAATALAGCSQIDTSNVGVETYFGQVGKESLPPGLYLTLLRSVIEVTVRETPIDISDMKPKTSNNVTLDDVDVTVYYAIEPKAAPALYVKYVGDSTWWKEADGFVLGKNLVTRVTREATYETFAEYSATVVHTKRSEIGDKVRQRIQEELDRDSGPKSFRITNVIIKNIVTDPKLEAAIKASAEVDFSIRRKEQEIELAKREADRLKAEAEGEAAANGIIARSLTPELVELRRVEALARFAKDGTHTVVVPANSPPVLVQAK